jgi:serine/threonine protein kinase
LTARLRKDLASRFARERGIRASVEHPDIARLYDAGVSPDGLPYLAMEYVAGEPLTTWRDARRVGIRDRPEPLGVNGHVPSGHVAAGQGAVGQ